MAFEMDDDELMMSVSEIEYDMECELMMTLEDLELVMDLEDLEFQLAPQGDYDLEWGRRNQPSKSKLCTHTG